MMLSGAGHSISRCTGTEATARMHCAAMFDRAEEGENNILYTHCFHEVAGEILTLLSDSLVILHSARQDYSSS